MRNRFKTYFSSNSTTHSKKLNGLKSYFRASCYWSYEPQCVARGVAAGLAGAVIPGFQIFYAAILVVILRGNLPIALLATLVTNPFTFVPITYFVYFVGTMIIGNGSNEFVLHDFQWDFTSFAIFWENFKLWLFQFGKSFLIGLPVVSLAFGIIGYIGTLVLSKFATFVFQMKDE